MSAVQEAEEEGDPVDRLFNELTAQEIQDLNFELRQDYREGANLGKVWSDLHRQVKDHWELKTGEPTTPSRGIFSEQEGLFRKHFGLEIHISHTYLDRNKPEFSKRRSEESEDGDRHLRTTFAYLTLPISTTIAKEPDRRHAGSSETGISTPLAIQEHITASSLARFTRALRILGFQALAEDIFKEETMYVSHEDRKLNGDAAMKPSRMTSRKPERLKRVMEW